mgnify:CR=1 FL=1
MAAIEGVGSVSYNGYTFPPKFEAKVVGNPVYDSSQRTVKHTQWLFTITAVITPDQAPLNVALGNTRTNIVDIRSRLSAPGRDFSFSDQGFGDILIVGRNNKTSGNSMAVGDISYGPKPRLIAWTPLGSNQAARVVWRVELALVNCPPRGGSPAFDLPSEFSWGVSWSINESGMTVRTISGILEVPNNRVTTGSRSIASTADRLRDRMISFPTPLGFSRTQNYSLSQDKSALAFSIMDTEIPSDNPYFPGCITMDVRHRVSGGLAGGCKLWKSSLSGTITVRPGEPRSTAWQAFRIVADDKIKAALRGTVTYSSDTTALTRPASIIAIDTMEFSEEVYGRSLSFNLSWRFTTNLSSLFKASGMWQPVPGSNWSLWKTSTESVTGVRGSAGMGHVVADDVIVSLCDAPVSSTVNHLASLNSEPSSDDTLAAPCPPAETSWLECQNRITTREFYGTVQHTPTAPSGDDWKKWMGVIANNPTSPVTWAIAAGASVSTRREASSVTQVRSAPRYEVWLEGWGLRVGFAVPIPVLQDFGGQKPLLAAEGNLFSHRKVGDMQGCPVYFGKWRRIYIVDEPPTGDVKAQAKVANIPLECSQ